MCPSATPTLESQDLDPRITNSTLLSTNAFCIGSHIFLEQQLVYGVSITPKLFLDIKSIPKVESQGTISAGNPLSFCHSIIECSGSTMISGTPNFSQVLVTKSTTCGYAVPVFTNIAFISGSSLNKCIQTMLSLPPENCMTLLTIKRLVSCGF